MRGRAPAQHAGVPLDGTQRHKRAAANQRWSPFSSELQSSWFLLKSRIASFSSGAVGCVSALLS